MSSSPKTSAGYTFLWEVDDPFLKESDKLLRQAFDILQTQRRIFDQWGVVLRSKFERVAGALDQTLLASALIVLPKAFAAWDVYRPVVVSKARALIPILPLASANPDEAELDPASEIIEEFQRLGPDQQDKSAKNLALLWRHFEDSFGGLSGFLASPETEQSLYLDKLKTASDRMKLARGSAVAFHYVTVEMMRLYVGCLRASRSDETAIALARYASALINHGRSTTPAITMQSAA
jgi:hypothetical protein